MKNYRADFATHNWCNASDSLFANNIEKHIAEKRQHSTEGEPKAPLKKRKGRSREARRQARGRQTDNVQGSGGRQ